MPWPLFSKLSLRARIVSLPVHSCGVAPLQPLSAAAPAVKAKPPACPCSIHSLSCLIQPQSRPASPSLACLDISSPANKALACSNPPVVLLDTTFQVSKCFTVGDRSSGLWHWLQPRTQCWEKVTVSWERLQQDPEEGMSLCRNPWALAGGKKVGQSWSNPALEPCPVCWEGICSEPCGCSVKIMNRAIKEAPAALMLCGAGRRAQLRCGEGLLRTPFSCQIPSQLLGWVSEIGRAHV